MRRREGVSAAAYRKAAPAAGWIGSGAVRVMGSSRGCRDGADGEDRFSAAAGQARCARR